MEAITAKTPWANQMDQIPMHLDYFEGSMVEKVMQVAEQYPNNIAFDFMGKHTTYRQMVREIERCARALKTIGIRENARSRPSASVKTTRSPSPCRTAPRPSTCSMP